MKITKAKLEELKACEDGVVYFEEERLEGKDLSEVVDHCLSTDDFEYANWLLAELMTTEQRQMYAVFAAEQVLDIFEKRHPSDNRPRKAIEAAKAVIEDDTLDNRRAAELATFAADAAAYAATRYAAAYAATAAANASDAAFDAHSTRYSRDAAANAAAASQKTKERIVKYGIELVLQVK